MKIKNVTARLLAPLRQHSKRMFFYLVLFCSSLIAGCGGLGYTPPPGAKLGDAFLSLKITTDNRGRMPQGADVVISIENASAENP